MFKKVACLAVVGAAVASHSPSAAQQTGTIAVTASITASCSLTTNALAFGALTSTNGGNTDVPTTASVTCTSDSPFNIGIDYGANASGFTRRMTNGTDFLTYSVYIDGFGSSEFGPISNYGNTTNFNSPMTGNNTTTTVNIYGRIPQQSTPPSGSYSDTLTVTLQY